MRNKKGAISLFVLFSCLFLVMFLTVILMYSSIRNQTSSEATEHVASTYNSDNSDEINETGGKYYTFSSNATYILMNDIYTEYEGVYSLPVNFTGNGRIEGNGKEVKVKDLRKTEETFYYFNSTNNFKMALNNIGNIYELSFDGTNYYDTEIYPFSAENINRDF